MRLSFARIAFLFSIAIFVGGTGSGCGLLGACTEPPDTHKGASLTGCSGAEDDDIRCCSYSGSSCSYTLCRDSCHGDFEEDSFYCSDSDF